MIFKFKFKFTCNMWYGVLYPYSIYILNKTGSSNFPTVIQGKLVGAVRHQVRKSYLPVVSTSKIRHPSCENPTSKL